MEAERELRTSMAAALGLDPAWPVRTVGAGTLDAAYPVSALATASLTAAAVATAELVVAAGFEPAEVRVDRSLCDGWFGFALTPVGWEPPSPWDPIAGDYATSDGWVRLHTNAARHRAATLRVLGVEAERDRVAAAVSAWTGEQLESAVVAEGGCAAMLRDPQEWARHPQGSAVAAEPLVHLERSDAPTPDAAPGRWEPSPEQPLAGLRVLDLTRVLAGPVATRLLAGLGADVLRIDPPEWEEPGVVPEVMVGKRGARLDARDPAGLERLLALLAGADVLVHGFRPGALESLGVGADVRRRVRPGLVEVTLDAYGWAGPWAARRGFDSLVQMSTGIAGRGLRVGSSDRPTPLPVQALDQATGYVMAAAVVRGLSLRLRDGRGTVARLSLARTAAELERVSSAPVPVPASADPLDGSMPSVPPSRLSTAWGDAMLLPAPFAAGVAVPRWVRGSRPLGSDPAAW